MLDSARNHDNHLRPHAEEWVRSVSKLRDDELRSVAAEVLKECWHRNRESGFTFRVDRPDEPPNHK